MQVTFLSLFYSKGPSRDQDRNRSFVVGIASQHDAGIRQREWIVDLVLTSNQGHSPSRCRQNQQRIETKQNVDLLKRTAVF